MSNEVLTSHLIGVHWRDESKKVPIGFRILGMPAGKLIEFAPYNTVLSILTKSSGSIDGIKLQDGKLVGSNGQFSRYQSFINMTPIDKTGLVILGTVGDVGYEVYVPDGRVLTLRNKDTISLANQFGIANGKVSSNNGTEFISSISGEYLVSPKTRQLSKQKVEGNQLPTKAKQQVEAKTTVTEVKSTVAEAKHTTVDKKQNDEAIKAKLKEKIDAAKKQIKAQEEKQTDDSTNNASPNLATAHSRTFATNSIDKANRGANVGTDSDGNIVSVENCAEQGYISVDQLLTGSMMQIKKFKPFYFAALKVIKRVETDSIPTAGVTIDTLYYNPKFIAKLSLPEINFLYLHEIAHIAMKHRVRENGRDHLIWNMACDYYINKDICDQYNVRPGGKAVTILDKVRIKFPDGGLYSDKVDVNKDTPEIIYKELKSAIDKAKQQGNQNQQGQQGGQGSQGQGGQGQQGGQNQQGGQGSSGQQGGQGNSQGDSQGNQSQQGGQGNRQQGGQGSSNSGNGQGKKYVNFRGDKVEVLDESNSDIINDGNTLENSDTTNEQKAQSTIEKIQTVYKQILESGGTFGHGKGSYGVVEAFVEQELIPKVNWRALVQNRLVMKMSDEYSLSTPDRRFIQRGLYIEGRRKDESKLEGIKLCIDTSGSMSDKDVAIAIGQIMQLCKMYDTQADLIYWDDGIQDIIPYEKLGEHDLKHYRAMGRGGTDPNCIFKEFSKKEYTYGLKVKPSLIIIFTDGHFGPVSTKYKSKFGRDTVWVLCSENSVPFNKFNPTFGRVATFRK